MTVDRSEALHASDLGPIMGLSPYVTPYQVWQKKKKLVPDDADNKWIRLGKKLEPVVAEMYAEQTGYDVHDALPLYRHPTCPLVGSPDRLVTTPEGLRVLEVKTAWTPRSVAAWGEPGTQEVPDHYRLQGIAYMALTDLDRCDFAVMMNGEVKVYTIWRDTANEAEILGYAETWWQKYVVGDTPPPMTPEESVAEIAARVKATSGEILTVEDGSEFEEWMRDLVSRKEMVADLKEEIESLESKLKTAIDTADGLETSGYRATWKFKNMKPVVDWQAVALEFSPPATLIEKHTQPAKPQRAFLIKEKTK